MVGNYLPWSKIGIITSSPMSESSYLSGVDLASLFFVFVS